MRTIGPRLDLRPFLKSAENFTLIEIHEGYIWVDSEKNVQKIDICNIWQYVYKIVNIQFFRPISSGNYAQI